MSDKPKCECGYGPGSTCDPNCPAWEKPQPTDIVVKNAYVLTREQPSLKSSFLKLNLEASNTSAQQLVGADEHRKRVVISSDAPVYIGVRSAMQGDSVPANQAFRLPADHMLTLTCQDEIWAGFNTEAAEVSVVNERWA